MKTFLKVIGGIVLALFGGFATIIGVSIHDASKPREWEVIKEEELED